MWLDKPDKSRKIIVDVDAGTDDAWALFMLMKAMDAELCDIKAITCVHGNTGVDHVVRNVLRVLQIAGKEKAIPVYKGCADPILKMDEPINDFFHGLDGFADIGFEQEVDLSLVQPKHAVNAIADIIQENANDIELVFLGPLTNLALALRMHGPKVAESIKKTWIMGGNYLAIGNVTKAAEFNFFTDPEAAQIVLDTLQCPIQMVPWETCTERGLTIPMKWRLEVLGALDNDITKLLNALDHVIYVKREKIYFKPCDALLTAVFLCPEAVEVAADWHASVELNGRHTRGQLVLDHLKANKSNVQIVEKVDEELFKKILLWTVGHPNHVCIRCKEE